MSSFNNIPNELVLTIFGKVSLQQRLRLRRVSPRWLALIEVSCKAVTSLKLFGTYQDIDLYCLQLDRVQVSDLNYWKLKPIGQDDDLLINVRHFSTQGIDLMARLFVKVKHLIVYFRDERLWQNVPYMLKKFHNVNSVSLCGRYVDHRGSKRFYNDYANTKHQEDKNKVSSQILIQIGMMTSLLRFDLLASNFFSFFKSYHPQRHFPSYGNHEFRKPIDIMNIASHLKRFSLNGDFTLSVNIWDKPTKLPFDSDLFINCTHLRLTNVPFGYWSNDSFITTTQFQNLKNLEFLHLEGLEEYDKPPVLESVSESKSLKCLWLKFRNGTPVFDCDIMFIFVPRLENLTELRIESNRSVYYYQEHLFLPENDTTMKTIPSLKRFTWYNFVYSRVRGNEFDAKLLYKQISSWFPNLEELFIYFDFPQPSVVRNLEANVHLMPHLTKYKFEVSPQDFDFGRLIKQFEF